jgi:hypothetical protein
MKLPRTSERVEQLHIVRLLRTIGAAVYVLGTTRRHGDHPGTMQTPGISDLVCFLPVLPHTRSRLLCIECKARDGRLSPPQREFRDRCAAADVAYVTGTLDDVIAWLVHERYLRREGVPHYRLRGEL